MHNNGSVHPLGLGKLSLNLSAKAWGFAGASLMLSRSLTLDPAKCFTSSVDDYFVSAKVSEYIDLTAMNVWLDITDLSKGDLIQVI